MLTYTLSTTKAKFKNKSCKIVTFLHWSFANAIGSMFCMYELINPWIISVVMFEFLSQRLIPVPLWAHIPVLCQQPRVPVSAQGQCAEPRLAGPPWEPKLNPAFGSSSAEASPSQGSCHSSCCCSGSAPELLAVGAGSLFHCPLCRHKSFCSEPVTVCACMAQIPGFYWKPCSVCLSPPLLQSGCTQGWGPGTPQAPKAARSLLVLPDLTALTASTATWHCTGAKVLFNFVSISSITAGTSTQLILNHVKIYLHQFLLNKCCWALKRKKIKIVTH